MGIAIYDDEQNALTEIDRFRPFVNGYTGRSFDQLIYLRNDDVSKYFTNVTVSIIASTYDANGEFGESGIGFKFIYGERRPTEAEWDIVETGAPISLPNIGEEGSADTSTYYPIWVRTIVSGGTNAGINDSFTIRVSYLARVV